MTKVVGNIDGFVVYMDIPTNPDWDMCDVCPTTGKLINKRKIGDNMKKEIDNEKLKQTQQTLMGLYNIPVKEQVEDGNEEE